MLAVKRNIQFVYIETNEIFHIVAHQIGDCPSFVDIWYVSSVLLPSIFNRAECLKLFNVYQTTFANNFRSSQIYFGLPSSWYVAAALAHAHKTLLLYLYYMYSCIKYFQNGKQGSSGQSWGYWHTQIRHVWTQWPFAEDPSFTWQTEHKLCYRWAACQSRKK